MGQQSGAVAEKPSRREGLTFSPQGNLLEDVSHYQDGLVQRSTRVYDEAGRLRETKWHNSDGTEVSTEVKYDQYGQPIRYDANVTYFTYTSANGRSVANFLNCVRASGLAEHRKNWSIMMRKDRSVSDDRSEAGV